MTFSGHLQLRAAVRNHGRTVLAGQSFRAPFHLSKAYWDDDARVLLAQVVNPTAGILAGDTLESDIAVDPAAALLVTTPSASRLFQMRGGRAECRQHFSVQPDGWLEVTPEPIVPHRGSNFHQVTTVDVAATGGFYFVDQLVPGRIAHGEAWAWDRLVMELDVRVNQELVLRERFDHRGDALRSLAEAAGSGATACFANAILLEPNQAADTLAVWCRELNALNAGGRWVGVSALRRGGWSIKVVAGDAIQLRAVLRDVRRILRPYFPRLGCDPRKL